MLEFIRGCLTHLTARLVIKDRDLHSIICPCGAYS